jgi:hypothetical protein
VTFQEFRRGLAVVATTGRLPATLTTLNGQPATVAKALIDLGYVELNPSNDQAVRLTARGQAWYRRA